ncbi:P-loop containing nucleoside triphosphate hydrolase protein [Amanita rubescens]|nr:P-loop containing nucleoside triphosphate hydrolase protein [Amanita rubescens]
MQSAARRRSSSRQNTLPDGVPNTARMQDTSAPATPTSGRRQNSYNLGLGGAIPEPITDHPNRRTVSFLESEPQRRFSGSPERETHRDADQLTHTREKLLPAYPRASDKTPNVIIFGETGVGKSSLINMITGTACAAVSSAAVGCTFESVPYDVELSARKFRLWDTVGLNEGEHGSIPADRAIESLQELVSNLQYEGVSLLVYCIRGSRLRDIVKINYDLFFGMICASEVPIVVVITGLENEDKMEGWWTENFVDFSKRGMRFAGHACITTMKGKVLKDGQHMFEEEYNQSVMLVQELISHHCLDTPWKPDGSRWFDNIVETMRKMCTESDGGGRARHYGQSGGRAQDHGQSNSHARPYAPFIYPQTRSGRSRQESMGAVAMERAKIIFTQFLRKVFPNSRSSSS